MTAAWYILTTTPNHELKVLEKIKKLAETNQDIAEAMVPQEKVIQLVKGAKKEVPKKLYPGYVFVNVIFSTELWHKLKNLPGVTGFIGGTKPAAVSPHEIKGLQQKIEEAPRHKIEYKENDRVMIKAGAFKDFYALVKEVNYDRNKLKVSINVFNRETSMEVALEEVELATD